MNDPTHMSIEKAFEDVRAFVKGNPGTTVISADSPPYIGWSAWATNPSGEEVSLRVTCDVKAVKDVPDSLRDYFRSQAGRIKLTELLQNPS